MELINIFSHTLTPPVSMFVEHPVIIINKLNKINTIKPLDMRVNNLFGSIMIYNFL